LDRGYDRRRLDRGLEANEGPRPGVPTYLVVEGVAHEAMEIG